MMMTDNFDEQRKSCRKCIKMNPYRNRGIWKTHRIAAAALSVVLIGTSAASLFSGDLLWAGELSASQLSQEQTGSTDAQIAQDGVDSSGNGLIEDAGHAVQNDSGISMEELQKAMDSGDQDALRRIAEGETGSSAGGDGTQSETAAPEPEIPGMAEPESVRQVLQALSAYDSMTGSDDELRAADYIAGKMKEYGYTVETQPFHEGFVDETGNDEQGLNIIAERGADSERNRTDGIFLVVTHYDTKRKKEKGDPFTADRTGVCALLEAARVLQNIKTDTDICFVFLSGEEDGLYGSKYFVRTLSDEMRARIRGVLDVERVGYVPETLYVLANADGQDNDVTMRIRQAVLSIGEEAAAAVPDGIQAENETAEADGDGGVQTESALDDGSQAGETAAPAPWDCVRDQKLSAYSFGKAGFPAAALTQYIPGRTGAGQTSGETETEAETEADGQQAMTADPKQIAHISNIVARMLSGIMNN